MIDRENTISNLETNIRWIEDIPSHQFPGWGNVTMAMRDAVELLKDQEPVAPEVYMEGIVTRYRCKKCGKHLEEIRFGRDNYCSNCGRPVKWE